MAVGDLLGVSKDGRCHSYQGIFSLVSIAISALPKAPECNSQVVEFFSIWIRTNSADWYLLSIYFSWFFFNDLRDDLRVLL